MQHFHCSIPFHHPQSSGLVGRTNGTIKTQLAKMMDAYPVPWPKAISLVLFNLRAMPFGKHHLFPFEIITGRPRRLDEYDPILLKGDIFERA